MSNFALFSIRFDPLFFDISLLDLSKAKKLYDPLRYLGLPLTKSHIFTLFPRINSINLSLMPHKHLLYHKNDGHSQKRSQHHQQYQQYQFKQMILLISYATFDNYDHSQQYTFNEKADDVADRELQTV